MLAETDLSAEQKEMLESTEKGANRLSEYVLQLKEISHLDSKEERRQKVTSSILIDWISLGQAIAKTKNIQIIADQQDESSLKINPDQLTQALQNIFQNAVDVSKSGTQIQFAFTDLKNEYHISISDNGPGFATEALVKGKERFYSTKNISGTGHFGLGLAIAKDLVQKNGGQIHIENVMKSDEIAGAKVTFIFPKKRD